MARGKPSLAGSVFSHVLRGNDRRATQLLRGMYPDSVHLTRNAAVRVAELCADVMEERSEQGHVPDNPNEED